MLCSLLTSKSLPARYSISVERLKQLLRRKLVDAPSQEIYILARHEIELEQIRLIEQPPGLIFKASRMKCVGDFLYLGFRHLHPLNDSLHFNLEGGRGVLSTRYFPIRKLAARRNVFPSRMRRTAS